MRTHSRFLALLLLCPAVAAAQTLTDPRLRSSDWVTGLANNPTTFTWIGPGEMFVIQKHNGKVRWVKDGVIVGEVLDLAVNLDNERGGLGITADPDFAGNGYVYIYYSKSSTASDTSATASWTDNRVERYTWNGTTLGSAFGPRVAFPADPTQANGANHDAGVIRFGPDGKLYGQVGDLNRGRIGSGAERVEQNTATSGSSSVGGIFRINPDGTIPSDNPFTGESDSAFHLWWSYGIRNGFGMTFDPVDGSLWDTEVCSYIYDEICRVPKGMNSGWLRITGPDARDAAYFENGFTPYDASDLTYLQNAIYVEPVLSFKDKMAPTAIVFLSSKLFPYDLKNQCVFADFRNHNLYLTPMNAARTEFVLPPGLDDKVADNASERDQLLWGSGFGVVTDAQFGADGYLYVLDYNAMRIIQIRPVTDEVDPSVWQLDPGLVMSGDPENAEASDDVDVTVTDLSSKIVSRPMQVGAKFTLNDTTTTSVVLQVETHYPRSGILQSIAAWNVNTQMFDLLDFDMIGTTDVLKSLTLATPSDYIDRTSRKLQIRITVAVRSPNARLPSPSSMSIDLLRLDVTYP